MRSLFKSKFLPSMLIVVFSSASFSAAKSVTSLALSIVDLYLFLAKLFFVFSRIRRISAVIYFSGISDSRYPNLGACKLATLEVLYLVVVGLNQVVFSFIFPNISGSAKDDCFRKIEFIRDIRSSSFIFDAAQ